MLFRSSVTAVTFALQFVDAQGRSRKLQMQLPGSLRAGQARVMTTGIGPLAVDAKVGGQLIRARILEE